VKILALSLLATAVSCTPAPAAAPHHVTWSYAGATAPEHWGELDPSFALCSHGTQQSPVDLPHIPASATAPAVTTHWDPLPLTIVNNGHTVQVTDSAPSSLVLDGVTYSLVQLHFHSPSEHTLEGRAFDAEVHLVHKAPDGRLAVIGVFLQSGDGAALHTIMEAIPMEPGNPMTVPGKTVDIAQLVPPSTRFLSYDGSLTTPPCTEGVRWLVAVPDPAPIGVSAPDLAKLRLALHAPAHRPTQAQGSRKVDLRGP
jgi:carbonic anhydrase